MAESIDRRRWPTISAILDVALDLDAADRPAYLVRACGGDADLRAEVEALLAGDAVPDAFLRTPAADQLAPLVVDALDRERPRPADAKLGVYRLVRELGEGGMGVVWLGERVDGLFQQQVAIKIAKQGIRGRAALDRVRQERAILARLQHPGIARLIDGGVTAAGTPYFVMERVDGDAVTAYCHHRAPDLGARLRLFLQICDAVQYAHRNLIVHRDLKPSNILVDDDGRIKLLDFGIAKLLGGEERGPHAAPTIERVLTPEYAAPEQVCGDPVSTSTDVYALGVLLYEMLTGERPYRPATPAVRDVERAVLEQDPDPPSARATAPHLQRQLRGDLDRVVLKALQKSPDRRYVSAEAFADDIHRYLAALPVAARGDALAYRASKFVRRHRAGVAAAVLLALTLVGGLIATIWQAQRAAREAGKAEAVKAFLESLFAASDPARAKGHEPSLRELLDSGARRIDTELADHPDVQSEVTTLIAGVYQNLGDYDRVRALLRAELERRRRRDGERSTAVAAVLTQFADAAYDQGRIDESAALYEEALSIQRERRGPHSAEVAELLWDLGGVARSRGDLSAAERLQREAIDIYVRTRGEDSAEVGNVRESLGLTYLQTGEFAQAGALIEPVAAWRDRHFGADHPDTLNARYNAAFVLEARGRYREAAAAAADIVARQRRVIGARHDRVGASLRLYARALDRLGREDEALAEIDAALAIHRERFGPGDAQVTTDVVWKAVIEMRAGRIDDAERDARTALRSLDAGVMDVRPGVSYLRALAGTVLASAGRLDEARTQIGRAESELRAMHHSGVYLGLTLDALGDLSLQRREAGDAVERGAAAVQILTAALGPAHASTALARVHAGAARCLAGDRASGEPLLRSGLADLEQLFPSDHPDLRTARALLDRATRPPR